MILVQVILTVMAAYALVGVVFALAFVTCGVARVDPVAQRGTWGFRAMILPGAAALWPLLLKRWISTGKQEHST